MNDRILSLEEKVAYLERHVTEQDKAMLEIADELAALRRELRAWRERAGQSAPGGPAGDDEMPPERPPHY
ncbi:MAG: SlyX family protein [Opitutaceae bacterium]|nr:SlyX family protein [Opitutaceae bacterium]